MGLPQARKVRLPLMNLVKFKGVPILKQLHLEEQLLRTSSDNWCIINDGTNAPTVVMGLSGKPPELLEIGSVLKDQVPVIRRFTGGGTVMVDPGTIFVTLICNKDAVPGVQPYPRSIMHWSSLVYKEVFEGIGDFQLCENGTIGLCFHPSTTKDALLSLEDFHECRIILPIYDYHVKQLVARPDKTIMIHIRAFTLVASNTCGNGCDYVFGNRKFGGNAQSVTRKRWIHHTSFLWDFEARNMAYLKLPRKAPEYRLARNHMEFVCRMKDYMTRSDFIDNTVKAIGNHFLVKPVDLDVDAAAYGTGFVPSTELLTKQKLEQAQSIAV